MIDLDETDKKIIALLKNDARQSNREIGRRLDVSEGTVRSRIRRLTDKNAMRIGLVVDPRVEGLTISAYVGIKAQPSFIGALTGKLQEIDGFAFLATGIGQYDIWGFVLCTDRDALLALSNRTIATMDGVISVEVMEAARLYKHNYNWTMIS